MPGLNRGPPTAIRFYVESRQPDGLAIKGLGHLTAHNYYGRIIDHGGTDITVADEFLDRADVIPVLKQMVAKEWRNVCAVTGFASPAL
jgi:hypothetical protein